MWEPNSLLNNEDLYLRSYSFTTAAAIIGSVDRKIFVLLKDGDLIFGILRSFDQFANLVIHDGIERIYMQDKKSYAETDKPEIYLIRGENVVMMGELDIDKEDVAIQHLTKLPDFKAAHKQWKEERGIVYDKLNEKYEKSHDKGLFSEHPASRMY